MRRNRLKFLVTCLVVAATFTVLSLWAPKCTDFNTLDNNFYRIDEQQFMDRAILEHGRNLKKYEEIPCSINNEFTVSCRREEEDVFIPFTFLKQYFEISGKISKVDDGVRFEWRHSYSRVYRPVAQYSPYGAFLSFDHYTVEMRDRVKCLDAISGVPLSTQWGLGGYYYPTQIAQFGLSHYSKSITAGDTHTSVLDDGDSVYEDKWTRPDSSRIMSVIDEDLGKRVIQFSAPNSLNVGGLQLEIPNGVSKNMLSFDIKLTSNASLSVVFESKDGREYFIHYVNNNFKVLSIKKNHVYYGLGNSSKWRTVTRDIFIDLQKGLTLRDSKETPSFQYVRNLIKRFARIELHGNGLIDNISVSRTAHLAQFFDAANWLLEWQDKNGGWSVSVKKMTRGDLSPLQPGWYSAMAQGHAISVLVRAYIKTKNQRYLDSAKRATNIFSIPSHQGGVLAKFMDRYDWYEEYPTVPSSFVLNGFMYSLFGLYDLMKLAPDFEPASKLYSRGIASLKAMLLLYDTGSGSIYDLSHYHLNKAPKLARWDYHTTHINQLLNLGTVDLDPLWNVTGERWIGYLNGHRAPHN